MLAGLPIFALCACVSSGDPVPQGEHLLVVAPESYCESLREFVEKRSAQLGQPVSIVTLEATAKGPGVDLPERLKREIFRRWKEEGVTAVLLVGDADTIPVRFMTLDRGTKAAFDTAFYPSDLYYGDLAHPDGSFDDWNGRSDGPHGAYFGEVHGETNKNDSINFDRISYAPEIAVGRWPVSTPAQAAQVAAKTLAHQDSLRQDSPSPRVDLFFSGGWIDNRREAAALVAQLQRSGEWNPQSHAYFTPESPADRGAMAHALGEKPLAIFHTGHGQPGGWEGCLDGRVMAGAPVTATPPLLFSIGCSTAEICNLPPYTAYRDTSGTFHAGTNRGEVFPSYPPAPDPLPQGELNFTSIAEDALRTPNSGAIAVIGCVTGAQPCAHSLLDGFVGAMVAQPEASIGRWWTSALNHYIAAQHLDELKPTESWYPASIYFQGMKFVLLGDPTVRLKPVASTQAHD